MFRRRRIDIGQLLGITISVDLSWLIVAALVSWSLATGFFPAMMPELAPGFAWFLAGLATLGLYASIIVHEFAHALTARRYGVGTRRITLFIFGGVAELEEEPPTPAAEFVIAVAGPAASLVVAVACLLGGTATVAIVGSIPLSMAVLWVGQINLVLALFNLIPAFPLDGGRVLRSAIWWWRKDLLVATRISSQVGQAFAFGLIGLGVYRAVASGSIAGGVWLCLIGMFVRNAARMTLAQTTWRQALAGETVSQYMHADPVVVPRHVSIEELMGSYVQRLQLTSFPVVDDRRLLGLVHAQTAAQTPRAEWNRLSVGTLTEPRSAANTVAPETDALEALGVMRRGGRRQLLVAEGEQLLGTITLADLLAGLAPQPPQEPSPA